MNNLLSHKLTIDASDKIGELAELAESLEPNCLNDLDERVWEIAKESKEMPLFCNIYINEVFCLLEYLISEKYGNLNLEIDFFVNSIDSHFVINKTEIQNKNDFYALIEQIEAEQEQEEEI